MKDPSEVMIVCSHPRDISRPRNLAMAHLAPEVRKQLGDVISSYLMCYGIEGVYERIHNRSVAQILQEFEPDDGSNVIHEGEIEGVRFRLSEPNRDV